MDKVTQWEVVGATPQISEAYLLPVLEAMLEQFPFRIRGFHSDNGSEFINHTVADNEVEHCRFRIPEFNNIELQALPDYAPPRRSRTDKTAAQESLSGQPMSLQHPPPRNQFVSDVTEIGDVWGE